MIAAVLSDDNYFCKVSTSNSEEHDFVVVKDFLKIMRSTLHYQDKRVVVLFDNTFYNMTKPIKENCKVWRWR
jgi:hypothetical protein